MKDIATLRVTLVFLFFLLPHPANSDVIHLKNGNKIKTPRTWREDGFVKCERFGGVISLPVTTVEKIEKSTSKKKLALPPQRESNPGIDYSRMAAEILAAEAKGFETSVLIPAMMQGGSYTDSTTGMEFVRISGGCYEMGSNSGHWNEMPLHEVCVDDFYLGKYEVTNRQYRLFKSSHKSMEYNGKSLNGADQPVVYVTWKDVSEYAEWLSGVTGKSYRLPSEAEWEYAARAGTTTARFWGDDPDGACEYANVNDRTLIKENKFKSHHNCEDGYAVTAPVGSFKPNGFGLFDMLGNVCEWNGDWYDSLYYAKSPRQNPEGISSGRFQGLFRVFRGGSWTDEPDDVRSARRDFSPPDNYRGKSIGFRLVLHNAN